MNLVVLRRKYDLNFRFIYKISPSNLNDILFLSGLDSRKSGNNSLSCNIEH